MNIGLMIGIALAVTITSIRNEKMVKEYKEKKRLEALKKPVDLNIKPVKIEEIDKEKLNKFKKHNK